MDRAAIQRKIADFLDNQQLGIISTIHADRTAPESAVVGFGNNESLELVFGTSNTARKYHNLQQNPAVSLVVGWSSTTGSLQYEGIARELSPEEASTYYPLLLQKNTSHQDFFNESTQRYFLVTPTWIRFYDNAGTPPEVYLLEF